MGRGLAAILPEASAGDAGELRELPVGLIKPNPNQPRTHFDQQALDALAASIEARGVIQPLLVRPLHDGSYELVAGERRWRASQQAGLEKVPAVVRSAEQAERLEVALIENMVREDLNPVEEARACAALVEELGLSKEKLAQRVGRSRPAISNLIRILTLPDEVLELLEDRKLSEGHGRALLGLEDHDARRRYARRAVEEGWSVREMENRVKLAGQPKSVASKKPVSAEETAALRDVADRFEASLGQEVKVRSRGEEISVEIRFQDVDEAAAFAERFSRGKG
jgi:ParB family chromosome partitioning protein